MRVRDVCPTQWLFDVQEREADLERVAAEALAASEAAEAQHSAEERRLLQEREQLEAKSAQVGKHPPCSTCRSYLCPIVYSYLKCQEASDVA